MSAAAERVPAWSIAAPALAVVALALHGAGAAAFDHGPLAAVTAALLGVAVFASVHHAEVLALRLGEPMGSILLAVAVTVIEAGLIVSIMLSGSPGTETVARDTIFSAVMIVMNVVVGLCLVAGGRRHGTQNFQLQGTASALAVLGTLAVITLILPTYTVSTPGPVYSAPQLAFIGVASLVLYGLFVFVQTIKHRDYFLDGAETDADGDGEVDPAHRPTARVAWASLGLLGVCLAAVVLLAKLLSHPLDSAVAAAGLPQSFVGVVVAAVVLLPESIASLKAAAKDRLQTSLNLALGSAIASIGLTIPTVAVASLVQARPLHLGLAPAQAVLLVLTLFTGTLTLGTGRTTVLQGGVHLVIGGCFLLLAAVP